MLLLHKTNAHKRNIKIYYQRLGERGKRKVRNKLADKNWRTQRQRKNIRDRYTTKIRQEM